jgi:hypothetical protein
MKSLRVLYLDAARITDAGLKELAGLKGLQELALFDTKVTDAGLEVLAGLKNLRALWLDGPEITDAALGELRKALPGCRVSMARKGFEK